MKNLFSIKNLNYRTKINIFRNLLFCLETFFHWFLSGDVRDRLRISTSFDLWWSKIPHKFGISTEINFHYSAGSMFSLPLYSREAWRQTKNNNPPFRGRTLEKDKLKKRIGPNFFNMRSLCMISDGTQGDCEISTR